MIYHYKKNERKAYLLLFISLVFLSFLPKNLNDGSKNFNPVDRAQLMEIVKRNHPNPKLVSAIIQIESGWRPLIVSNKGARGLMQVMPSTAMLFGFSKEDLFCPAKNIIAGTTILKHYQRISPNLRVALAKYSGGARNYYERVQKEMKL